MEKLLEQIKAVTGHKSFEHLFSARNSYEVWVTEKDENGVYVVVEANKGITVYGRKPGSDCDTSYLYSDVIEEFKKDYPVVLSIITLERHAERMPENKIDTAEKLMAWCEENELLLVLDDAEAKAVISSYLETENVLYQLNGRIFNINNGNVMPYFIDSVIDIAAENNYERMCDLEDALKGKGSEKVDAVSGFSECVRKFSELQELKIRDKSLVSAYSKTIYGKRYLLNYKIVLEKTKNNATKINNNRKRR